MNLILIVVVPSQAVVDIIDVILRLFVFIVGHV